MIGINKSNKAAFQQHKQEMYLKHLEEIDAYQMRNLGNYERLYPPMKLYYKTEIPDVNKPEIPEGLDPLQLKLYLHDLEMKRQRENRKSPKLKEERIVDTLLPGNVIDEKTYFYYQKFVMIAKGFVGDLP